MKTIAIVVLWFVFISVLATAVSCSSAHQCDAYGQQQTLDNNKNLG